MEEWMGGRDKEEWKRVGASEGKGASRGMMKWGERGKVVAKVEICWRLIKAWMVGRGGGVDVCVEVDGRVMECRSVENLYSDSVKKGMLVESMELVAEQQRNKKGAERVKTSTMKGCVGGRHVGVELTKKKKLDGGFSCAPSGLLDVHD